MHLNIRLDLTSEQVRLHLLKGLDSWVRLGLISDAQIREIARTLSDSLPSTQVNQAAPLPSTPPSPIPHSPTPPLPQPNKITQALRALLEEFSVIWLLFLGVFLVVVSSGVLAASQWQSFSAVGQYAVLLAYTLAFWGATVWAQRQENLHATAKMLALTTVLLIPINFWMMDALNIWRAATSEGSLLSPLGIGVGALSAGLLSSLLLKLLTHRANQFNIMGLSWLHFGWLVSGWTVWPVAATYIGTIGTAAMLTYQDRQSAAESTELSSVPETEATTSRLISFDALAIALSVLILLFRSLLVVQVPPYKLGLAAGICGWLMCWLSRHKASRGLWQWPGFGLLLLGWAVSGGQQPPVQAIAISTLALWILWNRLKLSWDKGYLLALIGVAGQAYWLLGGLVPPITKETILTQLSQQLSSQPIGQGEWMSIGFIPFLWGLLWFARQLRHWQRTELAQFSESAALALGIGLAVLSVSNRFTLAANLLLLAATLLVIVRRRPQIKSLMVTLAHGTGIGAIAAWINYLQPDLSVAQWALFLLLGGVTEFALHIALNSHRWQKNTWGAGLSLFALSYPLQLQSWNLHSDWTWLVVPITLTLAANHRRALFPTSLAKVTMLAIVLQTPWLTSWGIAISSFAIGTLCMLCNSRIWRSRWAALFTVGSGVAFVCSTTWYGLIVQLNISEARWLIVWIFEIWALWLLARLLHRRSGNLAGLYQKAAEVWGIVLMVGLLLLGTLAAGYSLGRSLYQGVVVQAHSFGYLLLAITLLTAILMEAIHHRPTEWRYWSLGWAGAIALTLGLDLAGISLPGTAIAFLALAFIIQIAGDIWTIRRPPYRLSWHGIPLAYAAVGIGMSHSVMVPFQATTGLYTLAASAVMMSVGRRRQRQLATKSTALSPISYLGLAAFSAGAYELLIYQMSLASGGQVGDGFTLLALLALAIALLQKLLSALLISYLRLPKSALQSVSQAHWAFGSGLAVMAALSGLSQPTGIALWTVTSLSLAAYALATGNHRWTPTTQVSNHAVWTGIGIVQILLCVAHNRFVWFPDRTFVLTWGGVMACLASLILYQVPWARLGWPLRPWRLLSLWLPLSVLGVAINYRVPTQSLLIVGAFYAGMAKQFDRVRLSYLSIVLFDWALLRYLNELGWLTALIFSLVVSISVLYVAQVEPYFQAVSKRQQRHWLRSLASALIGLTALYQAETYSPMLLYAAVTLLLCVALIFAGLSLKVRAFLYIGTFTFVMQIVRVLWLFISTYSLLLWAVGIVLGLLFIWVAATFESRRSQVTTRLDAWTSALETWE